jgi:hypothetical protein
MRGSVKVKTLNLYEKPKVADITGWTELFVSDFARVEVAENHRAFVRVKTDATKGFRYLYGENAYNDARRIAADADPIAWVKL